MLKLLKILATLFIVGGVTGCAVGTTSVFKGDVVPLSPDEAVVVFGVKSPGFRVMLFPVSVKEGQFSVSPFDNAVVNGFPTDGYLVAKVKAGQMFGVARVVAPKGTALLGDIFSPCGNNRGLVFQAPRAGQVVYLTDVEYLRDGNRLEVRYTNELERAERYMKQRYSSMAGNLSKHEFQLMDATKSCGPTTITIPVYVGR